MTMNPIIGIAAAVVFLLGLASTTSAAPVPIDGEVRQLLTEQIDVHQLLTAQIEQPVNGVDVDPALLVATGAQEVLVKLKSSPVAEMANSMSQLELMAHKAMVENEQSTFMDRTGTKAKEITCVQTLLNAVFLNIDASEVGAIASDPDVVAIHRVTNYEMMLDETVPYIGATKVQNEGYDGTGVKVAVLDSGIDYTHAAFGGEGTQAAYDAAYKDFTSRDGLFPTEKVIEGFDFVGETWPEGPVTQDNDPIDIFSHGTPVADIIGGKDGVAPGCSLYAVKVCSAVSTRCNGMALIQGMEYAIDPNGDGDTSDAVDIINLSIGSKYGQPFDDDLSQAVNAATALGVLVVASAGNSGDKPYISGTPASALTALSVANTRVPSASLQFLSVNDGVTSIDYPAIFQPWSQPLDGVLVGPIQYGDGQGENLDGCLDYAPGNIVGKVVLVDRGECNFTLKISNISRGGGLAGIIALIAEGRPFTAGDGGDEPTDVPGYMISQADADAIKETLPGGVATIDPANTLPLVMTVEASSSRGPQNQETTLIKPEIAAPGSSVAAVAGEGTGTRPFSGTSGAAPMITGSAALLLQKYPFLTPHEVKARLMNTAETNIDTDFDLGLAPITRIGGGEVRVDRALSARAAAWDEDTLQGALSFGFVDVYRKSHQLFKRILIRNYSDDVITYSITPTFRYEDDEASGAVSVETIFPGQVRVGPKEDRTVSVVMTIIGDRLPSNFMNSGSQGNNGDDLTRNEFDGYLLLDDGVQPIHMAWHVLPRKAANVTVDTDKLDFTENRTAVGITNTGVGVAQIDSYSLLAESGNLPEGGPGELSPTPDIRAIGVATLEVGPDVCSDVDSFIWQFAISTWERQQHLYVVRHIVFLDTDQDGKDDFVILNSDFTGIAASEVPDGRQTVFSVDLGAASTNSRFFAEHSMNTGNAMISVCAEQIGMNQTDLRSTSVNVRVETRSILGGPGDSVGGLTVTPGAERFVADSGDLGYDEFGTITVSDRGNFQGNSDELGVMLFTNGDRGEGSRGGATEESELILLRV